MVADGQGAFEFVLRSAKGGGGHKGVNIEERQSFQALARSAPLCSRPRAFAGPKRGLEPV